MCVCVCISLFGRFRLKPHLLLSLTTKPNSFALVGVIYMDGCVIFLSLGTSLGTGLVERSSKYLIQKMLKVFWVKSLLGKY